MISNGNSLMTAEKNKSLQLSSLANGLPGITVAYGQVLAEAGAICFNDQDHPNGTALDVKGDFKSQYDVYWPPVTDQITRCYSEEERTTELGAEGVALLLTLDLTDSTIIQRSFRGTGFDYWLGQVIGDEELPFQNTERLEISGIRNGDYNQVKARVKKKQTQVKASDNMDLPALIIVIEFSTPIAQVERHERN